jgi:hypothetical protein
MAASRQIMSCRGFSAYLGLPNTAILPGNRDALVVPSWPDLAGSWREVRSIGGNCDLAD